MRAAATVGLCALLVGVPGPMAAQQVPLQYTVATYWTQPGANPRSLMRGPKGRLWAGFSDGSVRILTDSDGDGVADGSKTFVSGTWSPHGLAWRAHGKGWEIYVAHLMAPLGGSGQITRFTDADGDDVLDHVTTVIRTMPTGAHQVNDIEVDPSRDWLYFAQGATSNEAPGGAALIGRVAWDAEDLPWGSPGIDVVATGLRNSWGLAFHPSGALFATENGRDDLGPARPPDELNHIRRGKNYGFPSVSGVPPKGHASAAPVGLLEPHASANGLAFDTGTTLTGFENQVFIAQWGGWTGTPAGKIVQANLHRVGDDAWHFRSWSFIEACGRPLDVVTGADGALYFTVQAETAGWPVAIYRVAPAHGVALRLHGTPRPGGTVTARLHAPGKGGHRYLIAASAGTGPLPTPLGSVGLSADDLLALSLRGSPHLVFRRPGTLDASGTSSGDDLLVIPPIPALSGFVLYLAAITLTPDGRSLSGITPTARLEVL